MTSDVTCHVLLPCSFVNIVARTSQRLSTTEGLAWQTLDCATPDRIGQAPSRTYDIGREGDINIRKGNLTPRENDWVSLSLLGEINRGMIGTSVT